MSETPEPESADQTQRTENPFQTEQGRELIEQLLGKTDEIVKGRNGFADSQQENADNLVGNFNGPFKSSIPPRGEIFDPKSRVVDGLELNVFAYVRRELPEKLNDFRSDADGITDTELDELKTVLRRDSTSPEDKISAAYTLRSFAVRSERLVEEQQGGVRGLANTVTEEIDATHSVVSDSRKNYGSGDQRLIDTTLTAVSELSDKASGWKSGLIRDLNTLAENLHAPSQDVKQAADKLEQLLIESQTKTSQV